MTDRDLLAEIGKLRFRVKELERGLTDAIGCVENWAEYADDYFRDKHNLAGDLARLRAISEGKE